jgi:uncharacterized membrane protein (DUF106 family)
MPPTDPEPLSTPLVDEEEEPPLPSAEEEEAEETPEDRAATEVEEGKRPAPARPPPPAFKFSTFLLVFLFILGIYMLFDTAARNQFATLLGVSATQNGPLYWLIGFSSQYLLLTMALAGAIEMLVTAVAYNYTTDWVKAAKVQAWSSAFRKVQMAALRSGKKDRVDALKPHQARLTKLSSEVSIAQLKGMAITWFLLILIYTWIGLVIANAAVGGSGPYLNVGGSLINLQSKVLGYFPLWFFLFSIYTVPSSIIFRRLLKHYWLRRYLATHPTPATSPTEIARGAA